MNLTVNILVNIAFIFIHPISSGYLLQRGISKLNIERLVDLHTLNPKLTQEAAAALSHALQVMSL